MGKYCTVWDRPQTAVLDNWGYKHVLWICYTHYFPTVTMVAVRLQTHSQNMLYLSVPHCKRSWPSTAPRYVTVPVHCTAHFRAIWSRGWPPSSPAWSAVSPNTNSYHIRWRPQSETTGFDVARFCTTAANTHDHWNIPACSQRQQLDYSI
jgi:hypothetical protein